MAARAPLLKISYERLARWAWATCDQASALLSARRYAEGIIHAEIGVMDGYENEQWIEAKLVEYIIKDPALRGRVMAWSARSFARGGAEVPRPKRDEHYAKVRDYLRELFNATEQ